MWQADCCGANGTPSADNGSLLVVKLQQVHTSVRKKDAQYSTTVRKRTPDSWLLMNPDDSDVTFFLSKMMDLDAVDIVIDIPIPTVVDTPILMRLSGLARASNDEIFRRGITAAIQAAKIDAVLRARPVYHRQFIQQLEEIRQAALRIGELLSALEAPKNHTALWSGRALEFELLRPIWNRRRDEVTVDEDELTADEDELTADEDQLTVHLMEQPLVSLSARLSALAQAAEEAKYWADYYKLGQRGRPRGVGKFGLAMVRFIAHIEFAAQAAGGGWTLNKNDERGTLIDALELLRAYLPANFIPAKGKHPFSSYQRILTDARVDWKKTSIPSHWLDRIKKPIPSHWLDRRARQKNWTTNKQLAN
jgi:hypothetical protein